ncbi:hypothetical protein ADIS_2504 [Lunatimonas lonarensis]|uniref:Neutral/alkaline non-lysosomal ceramidase N-terminal domain-containing protein n=1 Tax=Lunatimonas lonarensis TaxID=1232681 RepID=R7ZSH0_9BACT|nr:hypothetical protein [Lunatimonas lonarensis]EON77055.1 hypothetical protein ADIS_2504 [Lunatimonas lonarensis]
MKSNPSRFIFLLFFATTLSFHTWGQDLRVGTSLRVITPDPLLPVSGGVGIPKPATEKKGDLFARAAVFEQGNERFALVVVDNLGWPAVLADKSRALIKGVKPENVLIAATHTHSAPDAYAFADESGKHGADLDYLDWCTQQIADAVNEASEKLTTAKLKIAYGEAQGKIAYNYYAPILYDPNCGVIQALDTNGKVLLTLINYAIHPEVIGNGRGILSPDVCGPLYDRIEEKAGGMALFVNGALGGMVTADNRRDNNQEANDYEECTRIGHLLADEALRIVADAPLAANTDLFVTAKQIEIPIESPLMKFILESSPLGHGQRGSETIKTQLNLINLGPAQFVTIPGEALPNIGYYLKRNMPTNYPFLLGLCNDAFGYFLTKVDFDSFKRYEYITRTSLGELSGETVIQGILEMVQESPKPAQ